VLEIVDTVYLVAYLRRSDPLHAEAARILEGLGAERKVSQVALVELDLLMKSRGFTPSERAKTWMLLEALIPPEAVEPLRPKDLALASLLEQERSMDYFDALIASQCILRGARPLTNDREVLAAVNEVGPEDAERKLEGAA